MDIIYFNSLMVGISLVTVVFGVIATLVGLFYYGIRLNSRVAEIKEEQLLFRKGIVEEIIEAMKKSPPTNNPGHDVASRRDLLLEKFRANELSRSEAVELNQILLKEKETAQKRGDTVALVAIILGLTLLATVLAKSK